MALTTVSTQVTLNNVLQQITVVDTTDYAAQGVLLDGSVTVEGFLVITVASATGTTTVYSNGVGNPPDIDAVSSLNNIIPITLPQDTDGNILNGTYTITYSVVVDGGDPVVGVQSFAYDMALPVVCLTRTINCGSSIITSYDETEYGTYASVISRVHTLYPPPSSPLSNTVGTQAILTVGPNIYDKTWTQGIASTVTYVFPSGLQAVLLVQGTHEFQVVCDQGINKLICCIDKLYTRMLNLECKNTTEAKLFRQETFQPTLDAIVAYEAAVSSGASDLADKYYTRIIEMSGCGEECGCSDDSPQQIVPVQGSGTTTIVTSPDGSIAVVPVVVGSTTTYQIQVSAALQQIINNIYNVTVTTGTPSSLTITQSGTYPNRNYQIDFSGSASAVNHQSSRLVIDMTNDGINYLSLGVTSQINTGALIGNFAAQTYLLGQSTPNIATDLAVIRIAGVLATPTDALNITAQMNKTNGSLQYTNLNNLDCRILHVDNTTGVITLILYNPLTGSPYRLQDLLVGTFDLIHISFNVFA